MRKYLRAKHGLLLGRLWEHRRKPGPLVRLPDAVHTAIFAPTGVGKGVSFIIPYLLACPDSCVAIDFKGELAKATAKARRRMGQKIVMLDPFKLVTNTPDSFNPFDAIPRDDPSLLDDCHDVAEALVVRTGKEDGETAHFLEMAQKWIYAVCVHVAHSAPDGDRSLLAVAEILSKPEMLKNTVDALCNAMDFDGLLANIGSGLRFSVDKEFASTMTTCSRFFSSPSPP